MRIALPILLLGLLVSSTGWTQPPMAPQITPHMSRQAPTIVGYAYHERTGALFFTEAYRNRFDQQGRLLSSAVEYRPAQGNTPLASKALDYAKHPYAPEFTFANHAADYQEALYWQGPDQVLVRCKEAGEEWRERRLRIPEPVVADAGFDAFLKDNMDTLRAGQPLQFNFINPARLDWFRFRAEPLEQSPHTITLRVYPENTLLRWLVDPILLTYELGTNPDARPQLMHYSGQTNMQLSGDQPVVANIFYEYPQQPAQPIVNLF
ncbi:hypothetical protein [Ketobacter sp.]|uniref:hypothetical protein n=1 Tax=Ketobacter sp. TaxID=2083498 RepID=UPI0025C04736|nr:hypothetical protein [Ketobacter sp.]